MNFGLYMRYTIFVLKKLTNKSLPEKRIVFRNCLWIYIHEYMKDPVLKLVRTPWNVLLSRLLKLSSSLSMHLLLRMNVMLDFIWTLPVRLRGTRNKWTLQKNLVHGRNRASNTAWPPDYKSTVITTRPPIAWYESELNVHEINYR